MIIAKETDITQAVLAELEHASDPRFIEIMGAAVRHLHAFIRETKLTEREFQQACAVIAELGQRTSPSHNEVVLAAGSLGISSLVCLLNNGHGGETTANLLGPFWREGAPVMENGSSIIRSETPGTPTRVRVSIVDPDGKPVPEAEVDVWHCSSEGFYENQDPAQADMNLRGKFRTDAQGQVEFISIKPVGYPIPIEGPVGDLLRKQGRHNMRPAHIHFLVHKDGYKTQFAQIYSNDDPYLETDVQFGVTRSLVGAYQAHTEDNPRLQRQAGETWYALDHTLVIEPGVATLPLPPIKGKAQGDRPSLAVLEAKR
ncbi:MAG: catechol 1,2-dioxygenase [Pigmentiphaga sp.]|nr:catechol 1,2-dioxygenase [Pigmentiphaga sp.]